MASLKECPVCGDEVVGEFDACDGECFIRNDEVAAVIEYLIDWRKGVSLYADDGGSAYDALGEIIDELTTGEHR